MAGTKSSNTIGTVHVAPVFKGLPNVDEVMLNAVAALEEKFAEQQLAIEALSERINKIEAA